MKNPIKSAALCAQCAALPPRFEPLSAEINAPAKRSETVAVRPNACTICGAPLEEVVNLQAAMTVSGNARLWRFTYRGIL